MRSLFFGIERALQTLRAPHVASSPIEFSVGARGDATVGKNVRDPESAKLATMNPRDIATEYVLWMDDWSI